MAVAAFAIPYWHPSASSRTHAPTLAAVGSDTSLVQAARQLRFSMPGDSVPYCANFTGTGTIPTQDALLIFDRSAEADGTPSPGSSFYYDERAGTTPTGWAADHKEIGTPTPSVAGEHALIIALLVPHTAADFQDTVPKATTNPWSSAVLELGEVASQIVVTRSADSTPCP